MIGRYSKTFANDVSSGFVVFLIALPLCLGIALASNAPLVSGLVSGAIAGLIVTWFSGSELSVSGPAAGLTVTIAAAIGTLGSFESVLVAIFLSGVLQLAFGFLRFGAVASFFPNSVIKGMLAGIGLIIVLKQLPHAIGWDADFEGDESFAVLTDGSNTFSTIIQAFERWNGGATLIALCSLVALILWNSKFIQSKYWGRIVPAPLICVFVGTSINLILQLTGSAHALPTGGEHLVNLPSGGVYSFFELLPKPNWFLISNYDTWKVAFAIAVIGSIETLLSLEATDKLDINSRVSDANRELKAQGIGNLLCGLFGGLPITSVVVRSSANIYAGAKTRVSGFVHGALLTLCVLLIPLVLNQIPLSALAVVLIMIGLKLINIKLIQQVIQEGVEQWVPFAVTVVAILFTDLLLGVCIGLVVGLLIVVRMNHHSAITVVSDGAHILVRFSKDVSFGHKSELRNIFAEIPENSFVTIDGTGAQYIDHDVIDEVKVFKDGAGFRNIEVDLKNMRSKRLSLKGVKNG
ncbi:MAG: SulP family inorganic anion transporter [Proteobacteria bacterium]|nr:SulP family inorganic anion transporter [Pseudomonadota bacterium]